MSYKRSHPHYAKIMNVELYPKSLFADKIMDKINFVNNEFRGLCFGHEFLVKQKRCQYELITEKMKKRFTNLFTLFTNLFEVYAPNYVNFDEVLRRHEDEYFPISALVNYKFSYQLYCSSDSSYSYLCPYSHRQIFAHNAAFRLTQS